MTTIGQEQLDINEEGIVKQHRILASEKWGTAHVEVFEMNKASSSR